MSSNKLKSIGASFLFDTLKDMKSEIVCLDISSNGLDDDCMTSLSEFIQQSKFLEELKVCYNLISDKGVEILSKHLIGNTAIKKLDLSSNKKITDTSIPILIKAIESSQMFYVNISMTEVTLNSALVVPLAHNVMKYKANKLIVSLT